MSNDLINRGVSVRFLRGGKLYSSKNDPIAALMLGVSRATLYRYLSSAP